MKLDIAHCESNGSAIDVKNRTSSTMKGRGPKYKLSPNEAARELKLEKERVRKLRIQQVREQSKEIAAEVRWKVKSERQRQMDKVAASVLCEWEEEQNEQIGKLEAAYKKNLKSVGEGHVEADEIEAENRDEKKEILLQEEALKAEKRGREAMHRAKYEEEERKKKERQHIIDRQLAIVLEKARAAEVAGRPKPMPDAVDAFMEKMKKCPRSVPVTDLAAFSTTHYHVPIGVTVDRAAHYQLPNGESNIHREVENSADRSEEQETAKEAAVWAGERYDQEIQEKERQATERAEKARLRHKEALHKENLKTDYNKMMTELGEAERQDLVRKQKILAKIPKQIYQPPYIRMEQRADAQTDMEHAFEDMYLKGTEFNGGDLTLALDPHPPPSQTTDADLDVSLPEEVQLTEQSKSQSQPRSMLQSEDGGLGKSMDSVGGGRKIPSVLGDITNVDRNQMVNKEKTSDPRLKKLLGRIRSQREDQVHKMSSTEEEDSKTVTSEGTESKTDGTLTQYTNTDTEADRTRASIQTRSDDMSLEEGTIVSSTVTDESAPQPRRPHHVAKDGLSTSRYLEEERRRQELIRAEEEKIHRETIQREQEIREHMADLERRKKALEDQIISMSATIPEDPIRKPDTYEQPIRGPVTRPPIRDAGTSYSQSSQPIREHDTYQQPMRETDTFIPQRDQSVSDLSSDNGSNLDRIKEYQQQLLNRAASGPERVAQTRRELQRKTEELLKKVDEAHLEDPLPPSLMRPPPRVSNLGQFHDVDTDIEKSPSDMDIFMSRQSFGSSTTRPSYGSRPSGEMYRPVPMDLSADQGRDPMGGMRDSMGGQNYGVSDSTSRGGSYGTTLSQYQQPPTYTQVSEAQRMSLIQPGNEVNARSLTTPVPEVPQYSSDPMQHSKQYSEVPQYPKQFSDEPRFSYSQYSKSDRSADESTQQRVSGEIDRSQRISGEIDQSRQRTPENVARRSVESSPDRQQQHQQQYQQLQDDSALFSPVRSSPERGTQTTQTQQADPTITASNFQSMYDQLAAIRREKEEILARQASQREEMEGLRQKWQDSLSLDPIMNDVSQRVDELRAQKSPARGGNDETTSDEPTPIDLLNPSVSASTPNVTPKRGGGLYNSSQRSSYGAESSPKYFRSNTERSHTTEGSSTSYHSESSSSFKQQTLPQSQTQEQIASSSSSPQKEIYITSQPGYQQQQQQVSGIDTDTDMEAEKQPDVDTQLDSYEPHELSTIREDESSHLRGGSFDRSGSRRQDSSRDISSNKDASNSRDFSRDLQLQQENEKFRLLCQQQDESVPRGRLSDPTGYGSDSINNIKQDVYQSPLPGTSRLRAGRLSDQSPTNGYYTASTIAQSVRSSVEEFTRPYQPEEICITSSTSSDEKESLNLSDALSEGLNSESNGEFHQNRHITSTSRDFLDRITSTNAEFQPTRNRARELAPSYVDTQDKSQSSQNTEEEHTDLQEPVRAVYEALMRAASKKAGVSVNTSAGQNASTSNISTERESLPNARVSLVPSSTGSNSTQPWPVSPDRSNQQLSQSQSQDDQRHFDLGAENQGRVGGGGVGGRLSSELQATSSGTIRSSTGSTGSLNRQQEEQSLRLSAESGSVVVSARNSGTYGTQEQPSLRLSTESAGGGQGSSSTSAKTSGSFRPLEQQSLRSSTESATGEKGSTGTSASARHSGGATGSTSSTSFHPLTHLEDDMSEYRRTSRSPVRQPTASTSGADGAFATPHQRHRTLPLDASTPAKETPVTRKSIDEAEMRRKQTGGSEFEPLERDHESPHFDREKFHRLDRISTGGTTRPSDTDARMSLSQHPNELDSSPDDYKKTKPHDTSHRSDNSLKSGDLSQYPVSDISATSSNKREEVNSMSGEIVYHGQDSEVQSFRSGGLDKQSPLFHSTYDSAAIRDHIETELEMELPTDPIRSDFNSDAATRMQRLEDVNAMLRTPEHWTPEKRAPGSDKKSPGVRFAALNDVHQMSSQSSGSEPYQPLVRDEEDTKDDDLTKRVEESLQRHERLMRRTRENFGSASNPSTPAVSPYKASPGKSPQRASPGISPQRASPGISQNRNWESPGTSPNRKTSPNRGSQDRTLARSSQEAADRYTDTPIPSTSTTKSPSRSSYPQDVYTGTPMNEQAFTSLNDLVPRNLGRDLGSSMVGAPVASSSSYTIVGQRGPESTSAAAADMDRSELSQHISHSSSQHNLDTESGITDEPNLTLVSLSSTYTGQSPSPPPRGYNTGSSPAVHTSRTDSMDRSGAYTSTKDPVAASPNKSLGGSIDPSPAKSTDEDAGSSLTSFEHHEASLRSTGSFISPITGKVMSRPDRTPVTQSARTSLQWSPLKEDHQPSIDSTQRSSLGEQRQSNQRLSGERYGEQRLSGERYGEQRLSGERFGEQRLSGERFGQQRQPDQRFEEEQISLEQSLSDPRSSGQSWTGTEWTTGIEQSLPSATSSGSSKSKGFSSTLSQFLSEDTTQEDSQRAGTSSQGYKGGSRDYSGSREVSGSASGSGSMSKRRYDDESGSSLTRVTDRSEEVRTRSSRSEEVRTRSEQQRRSVSRELRWVEDDDDDEEEGTERTRRDGGGRGGVHFSPLVPDNSNNSAIMSGGDDDDDDMASVQFMQVQIGAVKDNKDDVFAKKRRELEAASKRRQEEGKKKAQQKAASNKQPSVGKSVNSWRQQRSMKSKPATAGAAAAAQGPRLYPSSTSVPTSVTTSTEDRKKMEKEMKERTSRLYAMSEEARKKKEEDDRKKQYKANRDKAKEYHQKQQEKRKKKEGK